MRRGFVLGKFYPPHAGHMHLCGFGRAHCDHLTILVSTLPGEDPPAELRHAWMREMFPDCRVQLLADPDVPQVPDDHPEFWPIWRGLCRRFHPERIDFVYASETYGYRLARELEAEFVPVDPARLANPVSGTAVRADPFGHWDQLPPPVRGHYARTVVLFGPESTGKTTLAEALARELGTVWVPEYGRVFTDAFGTEVDAAGFLAIARGQAASLVPARRQANRLLIADTDGLLTQVWADMLLGHRPAGLEARWRPGDLYLLTDIDMAWADDGSRYFPDPARRAEFFGRCEAELRRRRLPFVRLSGGTEVRLTAALAAIRERFPGVIPAVRS